MPPITADFTLTFEEFAEAIKLQRHRKRFLTGPPQRSPWIGCAVIAAMFMITLILCIVAIYATGRAVTSPGGGGGGTSTESDAPIVRFLSSFLLWFLLAGVFWLMLARSSFERRSLWKVVAMILVIGAVTSLSSTLTQSPATPKTQDGQGFSLLAFLPIVLGVIGMITLMPSIRRWQTRAAWDGQPQLQRAAHLHATAEKLVMEDALSRSEHTWPAFVSYSEGDRVFLLSLSALTFQAIPKRAFGDARQLEAFRMLLQSRILDAEGKSQGFPVMPLPLPPPPLQSASIPDTPLPPGPSH